MDLGTPSMEECAECSSYKTQFYNTRLKPLVVRAKDFTSRTIHSQFRGNSSSQLEKKERGGAWSSSKFCVTAVQIIIIVVTVFAGQLCRYVLEVKTGLAEFINLTVSSSITQPNWFSLNFFLTDQNKPAELFVRIQKRSFTGLGLSCMGRSFVRLPPLASQS